MNFTVKRLANFSIVLRDSHPVQLTSGPQNEILILTRDRNRGQAVHELVGDQWQVRLSLLSADEGFDFVQPMPGGNFLLVDSRISKSGIHNAYIFDKEAREVKSFAAGDGIEHVQTTSNGEIWIGFFDEGVFGKSLGAAGLVCLNSNGEVLFRYADQIAEPHGMPWIDDCYALNVVDQKEVWLCYYDDFPVVALYEKNLKKAWLDFPLRATSAFAVSGDKLLMISAYANPRWVYVDLKNRVISEASIADDKGSPIELYFYCARGPNVYFGAKGRDELYCATLPS
jgi:hypothetical protein